MHCRTCLFLLLLLSIMFRAGSAADMVTFSPYIGQIRDVQNNAGILLADKGMVEGISIQGGNEQCQFGSFIFRAPDIEHRNIWGGSITGDLYFCRSTLGSWVGGAGVTYLSSSMNSAAIGPYSDLSMENQVLVPYCRGGYQFRLGYGVVSCSFEPWIGFQSENAWGWVSGLIPGTGIASAFGSAQSGQPVLGLSYDPGVLGVSVDTSYSRADFFALGGLNFQARFLHMIGLGANVYRSWGRSCLQNNAGISVTYFFISHLGLSYRYEYMETTAGSDRFNVVGIAVTF